jgi:hypothetical protein
MILEGGSIEIDGNGSLMATKSSIINSNRNPNLLQAQVEDYLTTYLDVTNFIWLDGVAGLEITDMHIDGFARFLDTTTIVTMDSLSLIYWDVPSSDINTLYNAQNAYGNSFNYIFLPLTVNNVSTTWGQNIGYKGSYVNYYIGNNAVLVPSYNDPNDTVAISILQLLYPSRNVVGIDVRNLYFGGGMTHCVTQQQPQNQNYVGVIEQNNEENKLFQNSPNPFNSYSTISFSLKENSFAKLEIYNSLGQKVSTIINSKLYAGKHTTTLIAKDFENGIYTYILTVDNKIILRKKMIVN